MKHNIVKNIFFGLLLAIGSVAGAQNAANDAILDSAVVISYSDGQLELTGGEGSLFLYSEDADGYRFTYYLFTPRIYVHLNAASSSASPGEYIAIDNHEGEWINLATHTGAHGDPAFPINASAPFRCVKKVGNTAQILVSVTQDKQITDRTIRLLVLPKLEESPSLEYRIKHGDTTFTLDDFRHTKLDGSSEYPLKGHNLLIRRSNGIVIDSISIAGRLGLSCDDSPLHSDTITMPLDDIKFSENEKSLNLSICYHIFDKSGNIKKDTDSLRLSWTGRDGDSWWLKVLAIVVILLLAVLIVWTAQPCLIHHKPRSVARKNNNTQSNQ